MKITELVESEEVGEFVCTCGHKLNQHYHNYTYDEISFCTIRECDCCGFEHAINKSILNFT